MAGRLARNAFGAAPDTSVQVQVIRLVDVFLLGPTMLTFAATSRDRAPLVARAFLGAAGLATIVFNGANLYRAMGGNGERAPR